MGGAAQGPAAAQHRQPLFPALGHRTARSHRIHHALYVKCREAAEREASPTAAIIDSQSVKSAEKGGPASTRMGYDGGKKIKGKKRHVLVDTQGLLMHAIVHAADVQDRDGGVLLMGALFGLYPFLLKLYADSGYQGPQFRDGLAAACAQVNVEIVKRSDLPANSSCCPNDGSSNAPSPGSTDAAGWPKIGSASTAPHSHSCAGHPSGSCCESYARQQFDLGQMG